MLQAQAQQPLIAPKMSKGKWIMHLKFQPRGAHFKVNYLCVWSRVFPDGKYLHGIVFRVFSSMKNNNLPKNIVLALIFNIKLNIAENTCFCNFLFISPVNCWIS